MLQRHIVTEDHNQLKFNINLKMEELKLLRQQLEMRQNQAVIDSDKFDSTKQKLETFQGHLKLVQECYAQKHFK